MTVRRKLALTLAASGLLTVLLVFATVVQSFQRFENETAYRRGQVFLGRVADTYTDIVAMHRANAESLTRFLRALVLFEPDTELYLLDVDGRILSKSGPAPLRPGTRVALAPVHESIERMDAAFVMGDDPERMDAGAVIVARPVRHGDAVAGYLYLVLHTQQLPEGRWDALRSSFTRPVLVLVVAVVAMTTLLAALITASVTRPLRQLTRAVSTLSQRGLAEGLTTAPGSALPAPTADEFGQLTSAFEMLLDVCRRQWNALRRTDQERRQGISNLSHDLRTPLTASVACLETLQARDGDRGSGSDDDRDETRRLVDIALRNVQNAARIVRSLGDLAKLDEPEFGLRPADVDAVELLDDIALRFAERAARQGVTLRSAPTAALPARLDIELFERAVANLVDNALKACPRGGEIVLDAASIGGRLEVSVADDGVGIAADALPHLFDRFYQARSGAAAPGGDGGHGLGLAIVRRIAELHGGAVGVTSTPAHGTRVVLRLPASVRSAGESPTAHRESPRASNQGVA